MKRRDAPFRSHALLPPELAVGKCIEVWADDEPKPWSVDGWQSASTMCNYSRAFDAFATAKGLSFEDRSKLRKGGAPFSVEYLISQGRAGYAQQRLTEAGVERSDLPALRAAARRRTVRGSLHEYR